MTVQDRLGELGITLPKPAAPIASYVPFVLSEKSLYISGQLPFDAGGILVKGRLGDDLTVDQGADAARFCGLMLIAQLSAALDGNLDRVTRIVKLGVFVTSTPDFIDQPRVANGASDLFQLVFGERGRHARSAVGVPTLPVGAAVEVDAVIEIANG